jgi:hypothetical protein
MSRKIVTKAALVLILALLLLWALLGTGTSLAWFTDTTPVVRNSFIIGDLDLSVYYKTEAGKYDPVQSDTVIFDDEALYEPGYVQVVRMKVVNSGDVDFDYKLSIDVDDSSVILGENEQGQTIYLPNYLKFGVAYGSDEIELEREIAKELAPLDADIYLDGYTDTRSLDANTSKDNTDYVALILYMPESVGNVANYRTDKIPTVKLGVTVLASQKGTLV